MTNHRNNEGFTLIELLVAATIAAIIALTLSVLVVIPYRALAANEEYVQVRRDTALAMGAMARDIRESSFNNVSAANNLLILPPVTNNDVVLRSVTIKYEADTANGTLTKYIDNVSQGKLVNEGIKGFVPSVVNNPANGMRGINLHLEIENADGDISVVDETFIQARN